MTVRSFVCLLTLLLAGAPAWAASSGGGGLCANVRCVASDACHLAGTCDPATGACSNPIAPDGGGCDDGNACSDHDACHNGTCTGTPRKNGTGCDDGNACTNQDACQNGTCIGTPRKDGTGCNDGNACTNRDTCQNGTCAGTPRTDGSGCNDGNPCTDRDACQNGTCAGTPRTDGTECNTGPHDKCTSDQGTCQAGGCVPTAVTTCAAPDQCHVGVCDPKTGGCFSREAPAGTACNDGDACTQTDTCQDGTCIGSNPVVCQPLDQCHVDGTCDSATGVCSNPLKDNGRRCNDGDACTTGDACQNGACVATPVTCNNGDQCNSAGTCQPATGECSAPTPLTGNLCDDGQSCSKNDVCSNGVCGGQPYTCAPPAPCHQEGTCNGDGTCSYAIQPNDTPCNDGNACTTGDTCQDGTCTGTRMDCDDFKFCTLDYCLNGACQHVDNQSCDDNNPCTVDTCSINSPFCEHLPAPVNTVCRAASQPCETDAVCDGVSGNCPATNPFAPDTTVCRPAAGVCDLPEYCSGFGPLCPSKDDKKPALTLCRDVALNPVGDPFPCDKPEFCDGTGNNCPEDGVQSKYWVCRAPHPSIIGGIAGQACDAPEFCDGTNKWCPGDLKRDFGVTCSEATECRTAGVCKGTCGGTIFGAPCAGDNDCAAVAATCLPIGPPQIVACGSQPINENGSCNNGHGTCVRGTCTAGAAKFGGACDGDDFYIIGDPNRRYCGDDPDHHYDLKCCAGSRMAGTGDTGTCLECCNSERDEYNGGCPQNAIYGRECCSGTCQDLDSDPHNCGTCGHDCFRDICPGGTCGGMPHNCIYGAIQNFECYPAGSDCGVTCGYAGTGDDAVFSPGTCLYKAPCLRDAGGSASQICTPPVTQDFIDYVNQLTDGCEGWLNSAGAGGNFVTPAYMGYTCPLQVREAACHTPDPANHCNACKSDDDCYGDDICVSGCSTGTALGGFSGLCGGVSYCAQDSAQCQ